MSQGLSLLGSIRTCKVDTAYANKVESDRFLNPSLMVCPPWSGVDSAGRLSSSDAFYTKSAGCNSASDRVTVENELRPQYIEYVNLDSQGYRGNLYDNMAQQKSALRRQDLDNITMVSGNAGYEMGSVIAARDKNYNYSDAQAQVAMKSRQQTGLQNAYKSGGYRLGAGI